ncbi:Dual specificity protein kinase TTK [Schistosoma japonicum]|nr:Dual specificity protein kinase TTK [Schistosoma japonicum]
MLLPNVSRDLQKEIFKAYPKNIKSCSDWLDFLNHMENTVRSLAQESTTNNILLNLYEGAIDSLEANWSDEMYLVIFIRRAVLAAYENPDSGPVLLGFCSINGRRNAQLIAAVAYYYSKQGDTNRAKSLLNSTKKCVDQSGVELLCKVERMLGTDGEFESLLGPFFYKPDVEFHNINNSRASSSGVSSVLDSTCPNEHTGERTQPLTIIRFAPDENSPNFPEDFKPLGSKHVNGSIKGSFKSQLCISPRSPKEFSLTSVTSNLQMESLSTIVGSVKLNETYDKIASRNSDKNMNRQLISVGVQVEQVNVNERCITVSGKKYKVIDELGRGGSSVVYWAMDSGLNPFAVKMVDLKNISQETVISYMNEIEMLKSLLNSDRIIRLYDHECSSESLALVMEKGDCDLKSVILSFWSHGSQTISHPSCMLPSAIVFYWDQMLRCVKALHDRRIVHLDLKPQNFVLVCGQLKLIDLGISRQLPDDSTTLNQWLKLGTLSFMSPEQLEEAAAVASLSSLNQSFLWSPEVGRKSDIWSLGVILYMMVYGQLPFNQVEHHSRLSAIINPDVKISLPCIKNESIYMALKRSLVRNHLERASVDELLSYEYVSSTSLI